MFVCCNFGFTATAQGFFRRSYAITAEEFLFYKANERRLDRDQLKYTLRRVRRRLALLLSLNQRFKDIKRFVGK